MVNRTAKFASAIFASVLAGAPITTIPSHAAGAADDCLTEPGNTAPQGQHWRYRSRARYQAPLLVSARRRQRIRTSRIIGKRCSAFANKRNDSAAFGRGRIRRTSLVARARRTRRRRYRRAAGASHHADRSKPGKQSESRRRCWSERDGACRQRAAVSGGVALARTVSCEFVGKSRTGNIRDDGRGREPNSASGAPACARPCGACGSRATAPETGGTRFRCCCW